MLGLRANFLHPHLLNSIVGFKNEGGREGEREAERERARECETNYIQEWSEPLFPGETEVTYADSSNLGSPFPESMRT